MTFADFKTEFKNTPKLLKIASLLYIIPALVNFLIFVTSEDSLYVIYFIFNILMGIGLYKKNKGGWWIALILPFIMIIFSVVFLVDYIADRDGFMSGYI
ncbi:MAG: hypothetical protein WCO98_06980, partial [bacterium]